MKENLQEVVWISSRDLQDLVEFIQHAGPTVSQILGPVRNREKVKILYSGLEKAGEVYPKDRV